MGRVTRSLNKRWLARWLKMVEDMRLRYAETYEK